LVSSELFQAVAERLEENRQRCRLQRKGPEFLLTGLLICAHCRSAYCGRRQRSKVSVEYVYYRCTGNDRYRHEGQRICTNRSIHGRVEEAVWSDVCALLQDPDLLRREFEARLQRPVQERVEVTRLEQTVSQHKRRIARLIDAYENGWVNKVEFEPRVLAAKERLARDERALQELQQASVNDEELRLVIGQFDAFAAQIRASLDQADFTTKRSLLRLLIKRIEVSNEDVRMVYKVSLRPFASSPCSEGFLQDCVKLLGPYPCPKPAQDGFLLTRPMKTACRNLLLRQALNVGATGFEPATS
jgi:site-specific DNA recombinase